MPSISAVRPSPVAIPAAPVSAGSSPASGSTPRAGTVDAMDPAIHPEARPAVRYGISLWSDRVHLSSHHQGGGSAIPVGVEAGKPLSFNYNPRADFGAPVKESILHYRIDGGEIVSVPFSKVVDPLTGELRNQALEIAVPSGARGEVEFWFENRLENGEKVWDSRGGANFRANIIPADGAVVSFDEKWNERVGGTMRPGGALKLAYDADRLRQFMGDAWYRMGNTFGVTAYVSFDGKPATELRLTDYVDHKLQTYMPAVEIPNDAREVRIWFKGTAIHGSMFDSNLGQDYRFAIQ